MAEQPHVVILGAGFGGLGVLKKLHKADVQITLIDRNDYHTFQPLLYQVATAELGPEEVAYPVRELMHHYPNLTFHQDEIMQIDLAGKKVVARAQGSLPYDYLVIALGAVVNFFNTPGAEHAFPLYTMNDALRIKRHVLGLLEAVDKNPALIDEGALNFCIVGGGPTGVELAGAIADLIYHEFRADYPAIPVDKATVTLYEASPALVQMFKPKLQQYAEAALTERGVTVHTGLGVKQIEPTQIMLANGEVVKTHTLMWAAGLQANPLAAALGVELVHGHIPVGPDLQVAGYPGVFAIGDIANMTDGKTGKVLPGLGSTALQAGKHAGAIIHKLVDGEKATPFAYLNKGSMAQLGRGAAIAELPTGTTLTGHVAWLAWLGVHLALLSGVEERVATIVDWGWNFLTHGSTKRVLFGDRDTDSEEQT